jgi:hypothetical protein
MDHLKAFPDRGVKSSTRTQKFGKASAWTFHIAYWDLVRQNGNGDGDERRLSGYFQRSLFMSLGG